MTKLIMVLVVLLLLGSCTITPEINVGGVFIDISENTSISGSPTETYVTFMCNNSSLFLKYENETVNVTMEDLCNAIWYHR